MRQWMELTLANPVPVDILPPPPDSAAPSYLQSIDLEIGFFRRRSDVADQFSIDDMLQSFVTAFSGIVMSVNQIVVFDFRGHRLKALVKSVAVLDLADEQRRGSHGPPPSTKYRLSGIIMAKTDVNFMKDPESSIKIRASANK